MDQISNQSSNAARWAFFPGPVPLYFWILSAINGVITVVCNVLVVITVARKRRLRIRKSNWLLLSLAISDLAVGLILIPSMFTCYFSTLLHCNWNLNKSVYDIFLHLSVTNLCVITAERYIAVIFPLRHVTMITHKSTLCLLVAAWTAPLLISLVPLIIHVSDATLETKLDRVFAVVKISLFEVIPSVFLIICYAHIFQISRRHHRNISSLRRMVVGGRPLTKTRLLRVRLTVKVFCVVVPLFVVCWVLASWREICSSVISCSPVPLDVVHISRLLLKGHSMINPTVYALHKKDIRREFVRFVGCSWREEKSRGRLTIQERNKDMQSS